MKIIINSFACIGFFLLIFLLGSCKKDNHYLIGEWKDLTTDGHCMKIPEGNIVTLIDYNDASEMEGKYTVKGDSLFIDYTHFHYKLYIDKENNELRGIGEEASDEHLYKFTAIFKKKTGIFQDNDTPMRKGLKCVIQDKDGYTNVRSHPDVSSDILYKIYDNETFYVDPVLDGNWYCVVEYKNKPVGWIHKSGVKIVSANCGSDLIGTYRRSVVLNANLLEGEEVIDIIDDKNATIDLGRNGFYEGHYIVNGNVIVFEMNGDFGEHTYKLVYDKKEESLTLENDHAGGGAYYKESKNTSSKGNNNSPNASTAPTNDYNRNQTKPVAINSEMDFRAYINNKTFKSLSDNITFKYKNSENTVYIGNTAAGTLQVIDHTTTEDGTVITFLVRSPYRNKPIRYSFATPDILFDEEGREYRMR